MKKIMPTALVVAASLLLASCGTQTDAKWEYRVISIAQSMVDTPCDDPAQSSSLPQPKKKERDLFAIGAAMQAEMVARYAPTLERELNRLGNEGWELVSGNETILILRRRK